MNITRILAALALTAGLLAACGDDDMHDDRRSSSDHNAADVTFASEMIQHHAQALAMVDLAVGRPLDDPVGDVVEAVRAAQTPEIETMVDWLTDWDEPIPATVNDHMNADGHDMEGMDDDTGTDMPGMMSEQQMVELEATGDAEFPTLWLTMMIEHHEGAVEMARTEQRDGEYEPALVLAESIETSQSAEIATMEALLSGSGS